MSSLRLCKFLWGVEHYVKASAYVQKVSFPTSPLRWVGGKTRLLPTLVPLLGTSGTFVDAFCGSGRVSFAVPHQKLILGDFNPDAVAFHLSCRDRLEEFLSDIEVLFTVANNTKERYGELRSEFNRTSSSDRRTALWFYLNRHGFNGLIKTNRKGEFNVAYGSQENPRSCLKHLSKWSAHLRTAEIFHGDFEQTARKAQLGDTVYLDPPYVTDLINNRFSYASDAFNIEDQVRAAKVARELADSGVFVLISNSEVAHDLGLYSEADEIVVAEARRSISGSKATSGNAKEIIAIYRP
jgi:DNA adenine methylase